ncbi:MAG TPA: hypothetical protein VF637_01435, partial [Sphingomicrobium sp.]
MMASDNREAFAEMKAKNPDWVDGLSTSAISRLQHDKTPVLAWSATTVRNEDGVAMSNIDKVNPQSLRVQSASIMRPTTSRHIDGSVVIIDREAAVGKTLGQLANYAAMRGLAQTRVPSDISVNSILNLFTASNPPTA